MVSPRIRAYTPTTEDGGHSTTGRSHRGKHPFPGWGDDWECPAVPPVQQPPTQQSAPHPHTPLTTMPQFQGTGEGTQGGPHKGTQTPGVPVALQIH